MSLHSARMAVAAMAGLIAANPALAGRVAVVDDEPRYREPLPKRRTNRHQPPPYTSADDQARNLKNATTKEQP